jgi:hypothetical protein
LASLVFQSSPTEAGVAHRSRDLRGEFSLRFNPRPPKRALRCQQGAHADHAAVSILAHLASVRFGAATVGFYARLVSILARLSGRCDRPLFGAAGGGVSILARRSGRCDGLARRHSPECFNPRPTKRALQFVLSVSRSVSSRCFNPRPPKRAL